jgi:hypothetical protein
MRIEVGDDFVLTSDAHNIIVNRAYEKKDKDGNLTGEIALNPLGYYSKLEAAATRLLQEGLRGSDAEDIMNLVEEMNLLHEDIIAAVHEFTDMAARGQDKYSEPTKEGDE